MSRQGGLVEHSLNVVRTLLRLRGELAPDLGTESCVIVGLYHDVGKVGMPGRPYYLPNPSEWHVRNRGVNYIGTRTWCTWTLQHGVCSWSRSTSS